MSINLPPKTFISRCDHCQEKHEPKCEGHYNIIESEKYHFEMVASRAEVDKLQAQIDLLTKQRDDLENRAIDLVRTMLDAVEVGLLFVADHDEDDEDSEADQDWSLLQQAEEAGNEFLDKQGDYTEVKNDFSKRTAVYNEEVPPLIVKDKE